jgi:hypothetical protein
VGFSYQFPDGWIATNKVTQDMVIEAGQQAGRGSSPAADFEYKEAWSSDLH